MQPASFALDDCLVILRHHAGELAVLNPTARVIWEGQQRGWRVERIVADLVATYHISEEAAGIDVAACLSLWERNGLLEPTQGEDSSTGTWGAIEERADPRDFSHVANCSESGVHTQTYVLFDRAFSVRFSSRGLWDATEPLLAHLGVDSDMEARHSFCLAEVDGGFGMWRDGRGIARTASRDGMVFALHREIQAVGCDREWLVALHAAAVSDGEQCIVLAGSGGSGKSTLTAALLKADLIYLGDDVIPLDRTTREAVPLPLSLNLKPGSLPVLERYYPGIRSLPAVSANGWKVHFFPPPQFAEHRPRRSDPVKHLVFVKYEVGVLTRLSPIGSTEALRLLLEGESLPRRPLQADTVGEMIDWIASVPAYTLRYDNLDDATACVQNLFER